VVFQLNVIKEHPLYKVPLAYVLRFSKPKPAAEPDINMYKVEAIRDADGRRYGKVVALKSIARLIQLIPVYGAHVNPGLTAENSMDVWKFYYINSFMDKETYQAVW
jgi:hypothetical protein